MNRLELKQVLKKAIKGVKDGSHSGAGSLFLQVKNGTLTISSRNPIWAIRAWADIAEDEKEISCVVDSALFTQVVDKMTGDDIKLSISKNSLVVRSGKMKASIPSRDEKDWPKTQPFKSLYRLTISEESLSCSHALAKADARNGLLASYHIEALEDGYCVTATDGKRISICNLGTGKMKFDCVIDGEFLKEAISLSGGKAYLETDTENILVVGEGIELYAKTRPERYPNIHSVTNNKKSTTSIIVNRKEFLEALLVSSLMDDVVIIEISGQTITISNKPSIKGDTNTELNAVVNGPALRIGLNAFYLKEAIQTLKEDEITIHFDKPKAPIYLEEGTKFELVLPVNIPV